MSFHEGSVHNTAFVIGTVVLETVVLGANFQGLIIS